MQNTEEMFGGGSKSTISNEGREKGTREGKMKRSKIFKDSSVPGFLKCCSNYTLFHVLRQNLHVKCCNLFSFTSFTLRPLKKAEADFPLMKAVWLRNSLLYNFC